MDGAAQGGMVACEQELTIKAMEAWARTRPSQTGSDLPLLLGTKLSPSSLRSNSFSVGAAPCDWVATYVYVKVLVGRQVAA